jgi:hypothetical protein
MASSLPHDDSYAFKGPVVGTSALLLQQRAAESSSRAPNRLRRLYYTIFNTWLLEEACVVLALALLGTVLALVGYFNGKPLSTWTAALSFNTILAILSTPFRGAIILPTAAVIGQLKWVNPRGQQKLLVFRAYDQATRGPVGAVQLLATSWKRPLAAAGALIILASLVTDVFIQASMSIKLRQVASPGAAALPVLHNYTSYSEQLSVQGNLTYITIGPDTSLPGALYASVINSASPSLQRGVQPDCSTGQCAFGEYTSLALKPVIEDLTHRLKFQETVVNDSLTAVASLPYTGEFETELVMQANNFVVPYVNVTAVSIPLLNSSTRGLVMADIYGMTFNATGYGTAAYLNGTLVPIQLDNVKSLFRAFHLQFRLVAETRNASVVDGQFSDRLVSSADTWSFNQTGDAYVDIPLVSGKNGTISSMAYYGLTGLFYTSFNGSGAAISSNTTLSMPQATWTNQFLQAVYANGVENLNQTFTGIASGLSTSLRTQSNETVPGVVMATQSYYHARFGFLALPALLVVATAILVVIVSVRGRQLNAPIWKTDIVATIVGANQLVDTSGLPAEKAPETKSLGKLDEWARDKQIVLQ